MDRVHRLRETTRKDFNRVDDFKKLLGIDTWHQQRCKSLTNETTEILTYSRCLEGTQTLTPTHNVVVYPPDFLDFLLNFFFRSINTSNIKKVFSFFEEDFYFYTPWLEFIVCQKINHLFFENKCHELWRVEKAGKTRGFPSLFEDFSGIPENEHLHRNQSREGYQNLVNVMLCMVHSVE